VTVWEKVQLTKTSTNVNGIISLGNSRDGSNNPNVFRKFAHDGCDH
jgi:hypothetical protein